MLLVGGHLSVRRPFDLALALAAWGASVIAADAMTPALDGTTAKFVFGIGVIVGGGGGGGGRGHSAAMGEVRRWTVDTGHFLDLGEYWLWWEVLLGLRQYSWREHLNHCVHRRSV